ncbi:hypothetical protein F5Y18DRAFT_108916 [Xylariaceae sp. FL1019]|nr:hypothetical protein F5Y18DRAFT_108916 [Xylariaceae sp. FL1019]
MPHASSMPSPGVQALILCGPGSSFPTFTANPDENPKALLPIANRPMVWYPIDFCYRSGITNITLVCPPSAAEAMTTALNTNPVLTSLPHPRPDLVSPQALDYNAGTAEILRLPEIREIVTSDLVVLPCDLVCELGGDKLLQAWMVKAASLPDLLGDDTAPYCSGGLGVWYETKTANIVKGEETDFLITTPMSQNKPRTSQNQILQRLSHLAVSMPTDSLKDVVEEKSAIPVRHGLLRKHPKLRMLRTHRDAHIYFLPKWVMDFVKENERLETIGEDIVGWWAKATWQAGLPEKLGLMKVLEGRTSTTSSGARIPDVARDESPSSENERLNSQRSDSSPADSRKEHDALLSKPSRASVPPFLAYVHSPQPDAPLIRRVDNARLLLSVSLQLAKLPSLEEHPDAPSAFAHPRKVAYPDGVQPRTTITRQDCLIADNVMVDEKTSIKECVIGANCQIREGAKLFQCLLMDNVVVGKGCKLTRCILGKRSDIGEASTLTDCEVQENLLVEPRTDDKDNKLMSSSGLEASEQDLEDAMQDDEEGLGSDVEML